MYNVYKYNSLLKYFSKYYIRVYRRAVASKPIDDPTKGCILIAIIQIKTNIYIICIIMTKNNLI